MLPDLLKHNSKTGNRLFRRLADKLFNLPDKKQYEKYKKTPGIRFADR